MTRETRETTRIDTKFAALAAAGRAGLVTFVMAGDPDAATSAALLKALPQAGADVIEIGMPFTDPMADGPAIQAAGLRALHAGQDMAKTLALVRDFRNSERIKGIDRIYVPGERSHATRAARTRDGIPIAPALMRGLDQVAGDLGIAKLV